MKKYIFLLLFPLLLEGFGQKAFAQASLETFGHNRIQSKKFDWRYYQTKHFKVYYSGYRNKSLALFAAEQAEKDVSSIEFNAGGIFPGRISIILYNSYDDYRQTNIGLSSDLQMQNNNPAGTVQLVGNKLVVYFSGKHEDLRRQLRQGMAQVVMEHLVFGANFREMVRNAVLLDIPKWVTEGYVNYIVDGWTSEDDNNWKNIVLQDKKLYFNDLATEKPRLAGMAFWQYIALRYNENKVKNILYLVQLKGSVNKAVKMGLNQKIKETFDSVMTFYQQEYLKEQKLFEPIDTAGALIKIPIPDEETHIRDICVAPHGRDVAYVSWRDGEYKVYIARIRKIDGKIQNGKSVILYGGVKDYERKPDPDYPIIAWSNNGFKLGIVYNDGRNIRIKVYDAIKATERNYRIPRNRVDRITGFSFMQDDREMVISAVKNGQSDLYILPFRGFRLTPITNDAWDDADPVFVSGGSRKGIVFLSNRPQPYINIEPLPNELPTGRMNAYFYSVTTKSYSLLQLTHNNGEHIKDVFPYGQDNFSYLSDKNGVFNRYTVLFAPDKNNMDSAFSVPATNYGRSILNQNYNAAGSKIGRVIQYNNAFYIYNDTISVPKVKSPEEVPPLPQASFVGKVAQIKISKNGTTKESKNQSLFNPSNSFGQEAPGNSGIEISSGDVFQSDFSTSKSNKRSKSDDSLNLPVTENETKSFVNNDEGNTPTKETPLIQSSSNDSSEIISKNGKKIRYVDSSYLEMRNHKYYLSFQPDFFSVKLDNNLIFNRYQSYGQNSGQYTNPSLSGMIMAHLFDKMEDIRFTGGLRIPANFSGLSYFLQYENFKNRIDWGLIFYREENKQNYNFSTGSGNQNVLQIPGETKTNILQGKVVYPLNEVNGVHLFLGVRQDKMVIKAQDVYGLVLPNVQDVWGMARLEYISDNTRTPVMNIWNGFRYKLFAETMYKVHSDNDVYRLNTDTSSFKKHSWVYNLGFDARYYQKIYKNFIFAMRFAGAHSGGTQQILYFLGGEANALNAKFNNNLIPSPNMDYAFQSLATELRGYDQNARNGNTYLMANFELRLPVLSTFLHQPIQSTILKNLQAVAFLDVGNAWEGLLPTDNTFNRPYSFFWPPNGNPSAVEVQIPNTTEQGLAIGYGLGLRTLLWGYFIRADAALNKSREFHWYLSFGTDF